MSVSRFCILSRAGLLAGLLTLGACVNPHGVRMADADPAGWLPTEPLRVEYDNRDTLTAYNIDVIARLGSLFRYDRLGLCVTTVTPDGYRWRDTLYLPTRGRLSDIGLFTELTGPYRQGAVLGQKGLYVFEFLPYMPGIPPGGVSDVAAVGISLSLRPGAR